MIKSVYWYGYILFLVRNLKFEIIILMSIVQNIQNRNESNKPFSATEYDLYVDFQQTEVSIVLERNSPPMEGCPEGGVAQSSFTKRNAKKGAILTTINNKNIYRNFVENLPRSSRLNQLAKDKRKEGILSEVLFWKQVHKGCFHKIDFDRQRVIGNFIVDFYVKALGLVIEIDGSSHDYKQAYDAARQAYLESFGLIVFRCSDFDVKNNINEVFISLEEFIIKEYGGNSAENLKLDSRVIQKFTN
jgi:very-short-patch-repair endonuclease